MKMVLRNLSTFQLRAYLSVEEGENILAGTILAKISKQTTKSRDITGGLPRVTEFLKQEVRMNLQLFQR